MFTKYSRNELAGQFKKLAEANKAKQFAAQVWHRLGLVDKHGRPVTNPENGLPMLAKERADRPSDYNLHVLTEAMLGPDWVNTLGLNTQGGEFPVSRWLRESDAAPIGPSTFINVNAWSNTVAGLIQAQILEGYESEEYDARGAFPSVQARSWDNEKFISVLGPKEPAQEVGPGEPAPSLPMSQMWVQSGRLAKYAFEIAIAKETAWADITGGQVMQRGKEGGQTLAYRENELALDLITGKTNNFKLAIKQEDAATGYNTYGPTINGRAIGNDFANPLTDWVAFYNADVKVSEYRHPVYPNVPIKVDLDTLLVPTRLTRHAENILGAESFDMGSQPSSPLPQIAGSTFPTGVTKMQNPYRGRFKVISSRWLDARHEADALTGLNLNRYYLMQAAKAAVRRVGWEQQITDITPQDYEMAKRGIIAAQIGSLAVMYQVLSPWHIMRCKNS